MYNIEIEVLVEKKRKKQVKQKRCAFHGIIYKITNLLNNKIYIGQTINSLMRRWNKHKHNGDPSMKIAMAIKKYGIENFTIEIIDWANDLTELNYKEWIWISKLNCLDDRFGYNIMEGGGNHTQPESCKLKISIANTGRPCSELAKQRTIETSKERWADPTYRAEQTQERLDRWKDPEFRILHAISMKNSITDESREKQSIKCIERNKDPEFKAKWLLSREGIYTSDEFKAKMSPINSKIAQDRYKRPFTVYEAVLVSKNKDHTITYKIGGVVGNWDLIRQCSIDMKIHESGVSQALNGTIKQYKGYIFIINE